MATIAVCFNNDRNRDLLTDWITEVTEHEGIGIADEGDLSERAFDLCLLDGYCLEAYGDRLDTLKTEAEPRFLPYLLLIERRQANRLDSDVWNRVDDIIWQSATSLSSADSKQFRFELRGRLETLLDTRSASVYIDRQRNLVQVLNRVLRHNLRNDMSVIRGIVTMLLEELDERPDFASSVLEEIDELIDLSEKARQLESIVDLETNEYTIAVEAMLDDVFVNVAATYPAASLQKTVEANATVRSKGSLERALREVIENAVKHGGEEPRVGVTVESRDAEVLIRVHDNGPGLPEQEQSVLKSGTETPLAHGSGLGLWMVYWIVTDHDGTVTAETSEDGTTVCISLPRAGTASDSEAETANHVEPVRTLRQWKSIFKQFPFGIVVHDAEGRILEANAAAASLFGTTERAVLGRQLGEFLTDGTLDTWIEPSIESMQSTRGEITVSPAADPSVTVAYRFEPGIAPGKHLLVLQEHSASREHP